jgi:hypothetical protein
MSSKSRANRLQLKPVLSVWLAASLVVLVSIATVAPNVRAAADQNINVMTQNVYFGADLSPYSVQSRWLTIST